MPAPTRETTPTTTLLIAVLACGALACAWQAVCASSRATTEHLARIQAETDLKKSELLAAVALGRVNEAQAVLDFFQTRVLVAQPMNSAAAASITLHQALEQAEPHLASDFPGEPLMESAARAALAMTYQQLHAADQAIRQLERAVELNTQALGPRHPATLSMRNNLGVAYQRAGRHAQSLPLLEETSRLKGEVLGPDDPETIIGFNNLALAHRQLDNPAKAIAVLEPVVQCLTEKQNANHSDLLTCLNTLVLAHIDLHQYDPAIKRLEQMLVISTRVYGKSHPMTFRVVESLASGLYESNQPKRADVFLAEAIPLCRAHVAEFPKDFDSQSILTALEELQAKYCCPKPASDP